LRIQVQNGVPATPRASLADLGVPDEGGSKWGSSKVKALLTCPREYALGAAGIVPNKPPAAFDVGTLVHYGLEVYYRALQEEQRRVGAAPHDGARRCLGDDYFWAAHVELARKALASLDGLAQAEGWEASYAQAQACLEAYFDGYYKRDRWEVVRPQKASTSRSSITTPQTCRSWVTNGSGTTVWTRRSTGAARE